MFGSQADRGGPDPRPTAVEVHSLPADVSLRQLRDLINQGSPGQVLQSIAALDSSEQGVALIILASESSAVRVVEVLDGYPLGGSYLHVKRADSLPSSLVNLLYSLEQASPVSERTEGLKGSTACAGCSRDQCPGASTGLAQPAITWTCLRSQRPSQWPPCACMPLTAAAGAPPLYKL